MGEVALLLAADFRQILSVIIQRTRAAQINACLKESYLWGHIQELSLTINMQVHLKIDNADNARLLNMGHGLLNKDSHNQIYLPFQPFKQKKT